MMTGHTSLKILYVLIRVHVSLRVRQSRPCDISGSSNTSSLIGVPE